MALEWHPLRCELQIWLSCLPWAPWQTHRASTWKFCNVSYPVGTLTKPDAQMGTFLTSVFVFLFFNAFIF